MGHQGKCFFGLVDLKRAGNFINVALLNLRGKLIKRNFLHSWWFLNDILKYKYKSRNWHTPSYCYLAKMLNLPLSQLVSIHEYYNQYKY